MPNIWVKPTAVASQAGAEPVAGEIDRAGEGEGGARALQQAPELGAIWYDPRPNRMAADAR